MKNSIHPQTSRFPIPRDADHLAHTEYCRGHADGSLMLTVGQAEHLIEARDLAPGESFAVTLQRLQDKRWFTPDVQCDFTNVVVSNWLADARGCRRR